VDRRCSDDVIDVVKLYLRNNPDKRHLPAADLVTAALKPLAAS
jgi:hypothetical protein